MRILLISYTDYEYDGRTRALINVFSHIGEVKCFMYKCSGKPGITECRTSYPSFVVKAIKFARKMKTIDVLVLDNRKATVPGLVIKRLLHPRIVIQDCREFYKLREVDHLSGKIGCIFEQKMIKQSDILIAANEERAIMMMKEYELKVKPLAYENLRKLEYESEQSLAIAKKRIDMLLEGEYIKIISSSGCDIKRTNDILVKNLLKINKKVKLFLVGSSSEEDKRKIQEIIAKDQKNEIIITGRLNQTELKYLITMCDIGIVNYGQYDTNNKYCASGKLFEFIYEGIPVVTTTNPPLKNLCDKHKIGEADDEYYRGINSVLANYDYYKKNVINFAKEHTIEENDLKLISEIKNSLNNHQIKI